ncbi:hypothetical protein [Leyella stercorea]|uniref:hypothetical protein n=1 Tax=Leyella stercorea TaxID=363265 RepID=UPI00248BB575|nr:hypothetical protein [Leyella stercorea]
MVAQAEPCIVLLTLPFLICKHHTHRPTQTYASTDADIRIDRRRHAHRPTQTYAPTDADIRTDRRG